MSVDALATALEQFGARVAGLRLAAPRRYPVDVLRDRKSEAYAGWATSPGIYFFERAPEILYIGRALRGTGLRARVHNQCTSFGDPAWDRVVKDGSTIVGVIPLESAEWFWAASLEAFLIGVLSPPFNKRDS